MRELRVSESAGAAGPQLLYFEDVQVGQRFRSGPYTVRAEEIRAFAAQFDPQPFHLDEQAARGSLFGGLVASGWHTAAITMRLSLDAGPRFAAGTVGLGAEVTWQRPVRADDTLHVQVEVIDKVESQSKPDRGRVVMRIETRNQRGEVAQVLIPRVWVPRRAAASA
jgi:acyl dehydratase